MSPLDPLRRNRLYLSGTLAEAYPTLNIFETTQRDNESGLRIEIPPRLTGSPSTSPTGRMSFKLSKNLDSRQWYVGDVSPPTDPLWSPPTSPLWSPSSSSSKLPKRPASAIFRGIEVANKQGLHVRPRPKSALVRGTRASSPASPWHGPLDACSPGSSRESGSDPEMGESPGESGESCGQSPGDGDCNSRDSSLLEYLGHELDAQAFCHRRQGRSNDEEEARPCRAQKRVTIKTPTSESYIGKPWSEWRQRHVDAMMEMLLGAEPGTRLQQYQQMTKRQRCVKAWVTFLHMGEEAFLSVAPCSKQHLLGISECTCDTEMRKVVMLRIRALDLRR